MQIIRIRGLTVAILGNEPDLTSVLLALRNHQLLPTLLVAAPETATEVTSETDLLQSTLALFKVNRHVEEPTVFLEKDEERIVGYPTTPNRQRPPKHLPKHFQRQQGLSRRRIFRRR
jgi:hypothetical protein